jgi:hypothetical protein
MHYYKKHESNSSYIDWLLIRDPTTGWFEVAEICNKRSKGTATISTKHDSADIIG